MINEWGLRLIYTADSNSGVVDGFPENNEKYQLRELSKTYYAIIQEIKKMKKVTLTLKKLTDVLHIVLNTE